MPFPLHKSPLGFLELLRLRTLGAQPNQVSEQVTPIVDAGDFYEADLLFSARSVLASAAAFPLGGSFDAGRTRRWISVAAQVTMGANAGTYLRIRIGVRVPTIANPNCTLCDQTFLTPVSGEFYSATFSFPKPIVLAAGSQFQVAAFSDATGSDHALDALSLTANLHQ